MMLALPIDDPNGARDRIRLVLQNKEIDIKSENSVELILEELDRTYKKDDMNKVCEVWTEFNNMKRNNDNMEDYITKYDKKVSELKHLKIVLPEAVLAMQLLNGAEINEGNK